MFCSRREEGTCIEGLQVALTMLLTFLAFAATGRAQAPAPRGNLIVTVVDPSSAVIPEATVSDRRP